MVRAAQIIGALLLFLLPSVVEAQVVKRQFDSYRYYRLSGNAIPQDSMLYERGDTSVMRLSTQKLAKGMLLGKTSADMSIPITGLKDLAPLRFDDPDSLQLAHVRVKGVEVDKKKFLLVPRILPQDTLSARLVNEYIEPAEIAPDSTSDIVIDDKVTIHSYENLKAARARVDVDTLSTSTDKGNIMDDSSVLLTRDSLDLARADSTFNSAISIDTPTPVQRLATDTVAPMILVGIDSLSTDSLPMTLHMTDSLSRNSLVGVETDRSVENEIDSINTDSLDAVNGRMGTLLKTDYRLVKQDTLFDIAVFDDRWRRREFDDGSMIKGNVTAKVVPDTLFKTETVYRDRYIEPSEDNTTRDDRREVGSTQSNETSTDETGRGNADTGERYQEAYDQRQAERLKNELAKKEADLAQKRSTTTQTSSGNVSPEEERLRAEIVELRKRLKITETTAVVSTGILAGGINSQSDEEKKNESDLKNSKGQTSLLSGSVIDTGSALKGNSTTGVIIVREDSATKADMAELKRQIRKEAEKDSILRIQQEARIDGRFDRIENRLDTILNAVGKRVIVDESKFRASLPVKNVYFAINKTQMNANQLVELEGYLDQADRNRPYRVVLSGFADSSGDADYNKQLVAKRIESVKNALLEMGVSPVELLINNYGEQQSDKTRTFNQLDRKVSIQLLSPTGD